MSSDRLTNNGDGTVTDSGTELMWTAGTFERTFNGRLFPTGQGFSWEEAADLFGRGRKVPAENAPKEITPQTYDNFKEGTASRISVSGYNDWRLPNVEELKSMVYARDSGHGYEQLREIFEGTWDKSIWGANDAGFVNARYHGAWCLHEGTGVCEMPLTERYAVRLVRDGIVFKSFERRDQGFFGSLISSVFKK